MTKLTPEERRQAKRQKLKAENPEFYIRTMAEIHLKHKYGMLFEDYDQMLASQGGGCAICKSPEPGMNARRLVVDHCHKTNTVRGLLCNSCNLMLGFGKDRTSVFLSAWNYIANHAGKLAAKYHSEILAAECEDNFVPFRRAFDKAD